MQCLFIHTCSYFDVSNKVLLGVSLHTKGVSFFTSRAFNNAYNMFISFPNLQAFSSPIRSAFFILILTNIYHLSGVFFPHLLGVSSPIYQMFHRPSIKCFTARLASVSSPIYQVFRPRVERVRPASRERVSLPRCERGFRRLFHAQITVHQFLAGEHLSAHHGFVSEPVVRLDRIEADAFGDVRFENLTDEVFHLGWKRE